MATPDLSLILCSRNDAYLGNSLHRLETALNYAGDRVAAIGAEGRVEVIVADWGSEVPLHEVVALTPEASRITSFLTIPAPLARELQKDSPFAEVLALNAAARRARGSYIGRIDQDTLTGERFLRWFLALVDGARPQGAPGHPETTLLFANRRSIPYRLAVRCPPLAVVERYIAANRDRMKIETGKVFYNIDVGIWMLHRRLWEESGGYDERMIYMNDMEIDMVGRLRAHYPIVNLGEIIGYDFYHLDHYHPRGSRSSSTHRKVNTHERREPAGLKPSGSDWGLARYRLEECRPGPRLPGRQSRTPAFGDAVVYHAYALYAGTHERLDRIVYPFYPRWKRRAALAWEEVRGQSPLKWPAILRKLWTERPSTRRSATS